MYIKKLSVISDKVNKKDIQLKFYIQKHNTVKALYNNVLSEWQKVHCNCYVSLLVGRKIYIVKK